eukprot:GHVP01037431.1.p1 GENE.GHVP01037431.1~~GHVP01037431.1.p1  ORF type:complete len:978 (+),score=181.98 GHVP01037431.1:1561-4494(+)
MILTAEVEWHHMTLMHRFRLADEIIQEWVSNQEENILEMSSQFSILRDEQTRRRSPSSVSSAKSLVMPKSSIDESNKDFWAWIFLWLRFSYLGYLDWQRNYNTKPSELSHSQHQLTVDVSALWRRSFRYRPLIRLVLSNLGRGGNQGQAIRDKILDIMHKFKIPEHKGNFYEQWHQKLHNNTTPDDIGIAKAVIAFLERNGDKESFWNVLKFHGIDAEKLASYERPILLEPYIVPGGGHDLINDFKGYLNILTDVHDGLDLAKSLEKAEAFLNPDLARVIREVVWAISNNSQDQHFHSLFMKIGYCRLELTEKCLTEANKSSFSDVGIRELLMLDISLESHQTIIIQKACNFSPIEMVEQLIELLHSMSIQDFQDAELRAISDDWSRVAKSCMEKIMNHSDTEAALMLKALMDRVARLAGDLVVAMQTMLGPKSEFLGKHIGTEKKLLDHFVDSVLRASPLFAVSVVLKRLDPHIRRQANLPDWEFVSPEPVVKGRLTIIEDMSNFESVVFKEPAVIVCSHVNGEEEVPEGVQALLIRSTTDFPDILSHVAVRARGARVLLAVCHNPELTDEIAARLEGKWCEINCRVDAGELQAYEIDEPLLEKSKSRMLATSYNRQRTQEEIVENIRRNSFSQSSGMNLQDHFSKNWTVPMQSFSTRLVGSKSLNIRRLHEISSDFVIPPSFTIPFGAFQKALNSQDNYRTILPKLNACLRKLGKDTSNNEAGYLFANAQNLVSSMTIPEECIKEIRAAGNNVEGSDGIQLGQLLSRCSDTEISDRIKSVWASMFSLTPWISLAKANLEFNDLQMAILVQEVLPASYAFVLHTSNPSSPHAKDEIFGELVAGMGEALVANHPGRSLAWKMQRNGKPVVVAFPSKSAAVRNSATVIFRSDSNGEDLEGFAGAGLFLSTTVEESEAVIMRYSNLKIVQDKDYREGILRRISKIAFDIHDSYGKPMDIEGVVMDNQKIGVVQARPQIV